MAYAASYETHAGAALNAARVALRAAFGLLGVPDRVVDLGCGTGARLKAAGELGAGEVLGVGLGAPRPIADPAGPVPRRRSLGA